MKNTWRMKEKDEFSIWRKIVEKSKTGKIMVLSKRIGYCYQSSFTGKTWIFAERKYAKYEAIIRPDAKFV